jgi:tRNA splicing ligase
LFVFGCGKGEVVAFLARLFAFRVIDNVNPVVSTKVTSKSTADSLPAGTVPTT